MKLILDTCTFLWIIADDARLSRTARDLFRSPDSKVFLSAASTWEIVVKNKLGKLPLPDSPRTFIPMQRQQHGIESLPIDEDSSLLLSTLPNIHRDPFDRILICQAIQNGMPILTPDHLIEQYPVPTRW